MLMMLKRFANLLLALFGSICPLYVAVRKVISALLAISVHARRKLSHINRGSILWIVLQQSRYFATGHMTLPREDEHESCMYTGEFMDMLNKLRAKSARSIEHDKMPELPCCSSTEEDTSTLDIPWTETSSNPPPPKKPKTVHLNKFQERMVAANKIASHPSLDKVCQYCGTTTSEIKESLLL